MHSSFNLFIQSVSQSVGVCSFIGLCCSLVEKSCSTLETPWTVTSQAPLSMGFSRQEYWSGLPFPSPGDLPYPEFKPGSLALQANSLLSEPRRGLAK